MDKLLVKMAWKYPDGTWDKDEVFGDIMIIGGTFIFCAAATCYWMCV